MSSGAGNARAAEIEGRGAGGTVASGLRERDLGSFCSISLMAILPPASRSSGRIVCSESTAIRISSGVGTSTGRGIGGFVTEIVGIGGGGAERFRLVALPRGVDVLGPSSGDANTGIGTSAPAVEIFSTSGMIFSGIWAKLGHTE